MAAVAPPPDRILPNPNLNDATDLMKKMSLEPQPKTQEISDPSNKPSVESGNGTNGQIQSYERSMTPILQDFMDPTVGYIPNYSCYYYGSYDGTANEWDDYLKYANPDGVDLTQCYGYGAPYSPYSPGGSYQYPFYRPLNATSPPYNPTPTAPNKGNNISAEKTVPLTKIEKANRNTNNNIANGGGVNLHNNTAPEKRQNFQNSTFISGSSYGRGGLGSSIWRGNNVPSAKNHNFQPHSSFMGLQPRPMSGLNSNGYMNRMYPNKYGNYGSTFRSSFPFGSNYYNSQNGQYRPRGRSNVLYGGYGNENIDGLNELNKGPRGKNHKGFTPDALAVKGQNDIPFIVSVDDEKDNNREQYNKPDFPETYADAKFYIIKSYSEDDIHKSIKYSVWASTPNGNKKLDAAYQEAQQKPGGCPVFLFFSVNTSGQFVGVAEMVGPVDFHKNLDYWQQDKWNGFFPVKWHIVKDVSNSLLKHIILEYNENKPVSNSRDTQEVKLEQGLQMVKIFKDHSSKTCILDDFPFYEDRQKTIQEKKAKQQFQKQIWEGKTSAEEKNKSQKLLEPVSADLVKENTVILADGNATKVFENVSATNAVANGVVSNGL